MSQIQLDIDLEKKIYKIIDEELGELKRKVLHGYEYELEWDRYISTDINNDYYVKIEILVTQKFMEISEYCNVSNLEELYNECIENTLDEINSNALRNKLYLVTDTYEIKTYPLYCDSDYCQVGGVMEITIKSIDIPDIKRLMHYLEYIITLFIEL
ncbi:MAG: hypothetical protein QXW71_02455 [Thermoplasmata archaeon]